MTDNLSPTFDDPLDYDLERQKLARRRKIAEGLIATEADAPRMMGNWVLNTGPMGGVAAAIGRGIGAYDLPKVESQERLLAQQEVGRNRSLLQRSGIDPDLATAPSSIRGLLESQAKLQEASEQAAANRVEKAEEAERNRIEKGEQAAADRVAREDLRRIPAQSVHVSVGGGGPSGFGGTATQIGIDPRTDAPIYRHTKSGQLFQYGPDGQPIAHDGAIAPKPPATKEPTESERSSAGYLGRMQASEENLGKIRGGESTELTSAAAKVPFVGEYARRKLETDPQSLYRQSADDWIRAKLRKESGAVIGKEEMEAEYRTYFPQPGDTPAVIQQKAQSRAQAEEQMKSSAGRAKPTTAAQVPPVPKTTDKLTAEEQAELDQLRSKHGRK